MTNSATRNVKTIKTSLNRAHPRTSLSILIPAAGAGVRMKAYGPKSLIQLTTDTNVIQNQINIIHENFTGNYEIILVTGFQSQKVMDNIPTNIIAIENERYKETNVVRSIGMGLRAATSDRVLIVYGDLVFNNKAFSFPMNKSTMVISDTMSQNEVGCTICNKYVEQLLYDLPNKWAQITFVTGKELEMLSKLCWDSSNERMYGFEVFNKVIQDGGKFLTVSPKGLKINDIDSSKDIKTIKDILE